MKYRFFTLSVFAMFSLLLVSPVRPQGIHRQGIEAEIVRALSRFQEGYTERDTSAVESYVRDLFADEILIIGTGASEWVTDLDGVERLVHSDWLYWGDLKLDIDEAIISATGKVAWFAVRGTSTRRFDSEEAIYDRYGIRDITRIMDGDRSNRLKLLDIVLDASSILREVELAGTRFVYPIRVGGTLVREGGAWKFNQMVFSYPYPRRLILSDGE